MTVRIVQGIFVLACVFMGGLWGGYIVSEVYSTPVEQSSFVLWTILGCALGGAVSGGILGIVHFVTQELYEKLAPAVVAIVLAMGMGYFLSQYILWWAPESAAQDLTLRVFFIVSLVLVFGFIGTMIGLTRASSWESLITAVKTQGKEAPALKLVDTSVLIDGRIADVCESGFVEGTLLVPRFVLNELQHIADSADVLRRAKGRRGLDILKKLQDDTSRVKVEITGEDPTDVQDVDGKLVRLAKKHQAKILTNDFNLNKVAQIEGIVVLNLNDLANSLKPAVLPDEQMEVKIIKDGKEANQGVGYLDDGTMIVVDGGRQHMGRTVEVVVTSVLQTAAGRMIFGRFVNVLS